MRISHEASKLPAAPEPSACNNNELRKATRHLGQLFDGVIAPSGLRAAQVGLLFYIEEMGSPTMSALSQALVMDLSALGHTLKPLTRDGFVTLVTDSADRRAKRVRLTANGKAKLLESRALWRDAQGRVETALGVERARALRQILALVGSEAFAEAFREGRSL